MGLAMVVVVLQLGLPLLVLALVLLMPQRLCQHTQQLRTQCAFQPSMRTCTRAGMRFPLVCVLVSARGWVGFLRQPPLLVRGLSKHSTLFQHSMVMLARTSVCVRSVNQAW